MNIIRFIHIFSAIFWVGTTLFLVFFMEPIIRRLGPEGGKFMQTLLGGTRFSQAVSLSGGLTIIAGFFLYGPATNWSMDIIFGLRLPLTLGAVAGIGAGVVGGVVQGRSSARLLDLGVEITSQGSPPSQKQQTDMQRLQTTIRTGSAWSAGLMYWL